MTNYIIWYSPNAENGLGQQFYYKDGLILENNLNEQLDSGTIVLFAQEKTKFEPFDVIEIFNSQFEKKTMLIDNVVEQQVSFEPELFNYTISLMSKTKELERIVLPNFSVTRPLGGSARSLYSVISDLVQDYSPKYFKIGTGFTNKYIFGGSHSRLTEDCPDMQMTRPTLREAIDRVLSVIGCICFLDENNIIRVLDINKREDALDITKFNYKHENQSSADYASGLDNIYNNVTPSTSLTGIDNSAEFTEYVGFRDFDSGVVSEDNLFIETKYPIYDIVRVCMFCYVRYSKNNNLEDDYFKLDITDNVLEVQKYNLLELADMTGTNAYKETKNVRKISSVYYTRGDNKILNFSNNYKQVLWTSAKTIDFLVGSAMLRTFDDIDQPTDSSSRAFIKVSNHNVRETVAFLITYKTQIDTIRAKSGKLLPETHENNEIIDNPSEAFVDIYQQGRLFNQKVNRLGNRAKILTGRFTNPSDLPKLGDTLGDFVVMNIENQYYDGFIVSKAILTENYVNVNYFTGINARKRSWQIVGANEAFDKQLIRKFYLEFSKIEKEDADNDDFSDYYSPAEDFENEVEVNKRLRMYFGDIYYNSSIAPYSVYLNVSRMQLDHDYDFFELELQKVISGNSIIFTCGMFDNFSAALPSLVRNQGSGADFNVGEGGYMEYWNQYVNSTGGNVRVNYDLFFINNEGKSTEIDSNPNASRIREVTNMSIGDKIVNNVPDFNLYQGYKPRVHWNNVNTSGGVGFYKYPFANDECAFSTRFSNFKDSREKINFNIQFEYCSDTKDIVFGREFIFRKGAINNTGHLINDYKVYTSNEKYVYGEETLKSNSTLIEDCVVWVQQTTNGSVTYSFSNGILDTHQSIAIVTTDNKLMLAVNTTKAIQIAEVVAYLNLLQTRDRKHYLSGRQDWDVDWHYEELTLSNVHSAYVNALIGYLTSQTQVRVFKSSVNPTEMATIRTDTIVAVKEVNETVLYGTMDNVVNEVKIAKRRTSDNAYNGYIVLCTNGYFLYYEDNVFKFAKPSVVLDDSGKVKNRKYFCDMDAVENAGQTGESCILYQRVQRQ